MASMSTTISMGMKIFEASCIMSPLSVVSMVGTMVELVLLSVTYSVVVMAHRCQRKSIVISRFLCKLKVHLKQYINDLLPDYYSIELSRVAFPLFSVSFKFAIKPSIFFIGSTREIHVLLV